MEQKIRYFKIFLQPETESLFNASLARKELQSPESQLTASRLKRSNFPINLLKSQAAEMFLALEDSHW